jgi:hypothetical protein
VLAAVVVSIVSVDLGGDSTYGSGELFLEGTVEPGGVFVATPWRLAIS